MKRQFVHMNPSQGQQQPNQEQVQPITDAMQLPQRIPAVNSDAQKQRENKSPGFPQFHRGSNGPGSQAGFSQQQGGQENNSQNRAMPPQSGAHPGQEKKPPISMVDMETIEQPIVRDPHTEPGFKLGNYKSPQGFMPDKVSPFQSGVMPSPAMFSPPGRQAPGMPSQAGINPAQPVTSLPMSAPPMQIPPQMSPASGGPKPPWQPPQGSGGQPPNGPPGKPPFKKKKRRVPIWARVALGVMLLLIVGVGTGYGYYYVNFAGSVNKIIGQKVKRVDGDTVSNTNTGDFASGKRVNILLLGSDTDYKTRKINGGALAQTDMVVTIDTATHYVGMLSFPRDAWVPVPGYSQNMKLDQAYLYGNNAGEGGGPALAMATIHKDFGIPIDYYAWVGLDGFMKVIDVLNGVDVDVTHPIVDDSYPDDTDPNVKDPYALKRLYRTPGPQHLDGKSALEYVRTRHADLVGDFGRTARQQQVLAQLRSKLNNPDTFGKLKDIADALAGHVKTDMGYPDILNLMTFARSLDTKKIDKVTLGGPPYSTTTDTKAIYGNQSVVLMNCGPTMAKISKMFALGDQAVCNVGTADGVGTTASTGNYKNDAALATAPPSQLSSPALYNTPSDSLQTVDTMASLGPDSVDAQGDKQLYGMRSLLDLMFLTVFESPDALKT